MQKPQNYDSTEAKTQGEFETLPPGGYLAKIVHAEVKPSKAGREMLVLSMDIAEGEHAGFYSELSKRLGKDIWQNFYQPTDGDSLPFFKGLIETIETSNPGYKFNFDEHTLIGKKIGINLREEEYMNNVEVKTSLKVAYCTTVNEAKAGLPVMKKKTLNGNQQTQAAPRTTTQPLPGASNDDLPF